VLAPESDKSKSLKNFIAKNVQRGPHDLIRYYETLRETKKMPNGLEGYVSPAKMKRPYTLSKAIISSNLLRSKQLPGEIRKKIETALFSLEDTALSDIALNKIHF
jgi:hypothetical protein